MNNEYLLLPVALAPHIKDALTRWTDFQASAWADVMQAQANIDAAAPERSETLEDDDTDIAEGVEILDSLIASIKQHGNYGNDVTISFLGQIRQCLVSPNRPAPPAASSSAAPSGAHHLTPENIAAVIQDLREIEAGTTERPIQERDWRTQAGVWHLIMSHLAVHAAPSVHPDDIAVDKFAEALKTEMAIQRAKGRGGWDDPAQCHTQDLAASMIRQIDNGEIIKVGAYAMMLFNRNCWPADLVGAMSLHFQDARLSAAPAASPAVLTDADIVMLADIIDWSDIEYTYDAQLLFARAIERHITGQAGGEAM